MIEVRTLRVLSNAEVVKWLDSEPEIKTMSEAMKPALILNQTGIQIHLGEILGHPELVSADVLRASDASPSKSFEVPVDVLRVLGNEQVVQWLDSEPKSE